LNAPLFLKRSSLSFLFWFQFWMLFFVFVFAAFMGRSFIAFQQQHHEFVFTEGSIQPFFLLFFLLLKESISEFSFLFFILVTLFVR